MNRLILLLALLSYGHLVQAQLFKISPEDTQRKHSYVLMRDGTVMRGQILRQDSSLITVRIKGGDLSFVEADQVLRVTAARPDESANPAVGSSAAPATIFVLRDGLRVEGKYVRRDSTMITVRKRNGQLTYFEPELLVRVDTVRTTLESSGSLSTGERSFANRFSPWLLTGQTAYAPEKGQFYYRNTLGLLNEFDYGITRHWSVGASFVTPIPYLTLTDYFAFKGFLTSNSQFFSKFSVPIGDRFRLGLTATYRDKPLITGLKRGSLTFQALASIGSSQRNVTLGYGLINWGKQRVFIYPREPGYYSSIPYLIDLAIPNQSFLTLGISQKVSPVLTLISDNRINLGQQPDSYDDTNYERTSLSFALRLDRRHHAFDFGVYGLVYRDRYKWYDHQVRVLPYVGYNLLISQK